MTLLAQCPGLYVLATSREPLAVPGEVSWAIPPLAATRRWPCSAARATAVRSDFTIGPEEQALAEQLVDRLDGLPLAIELAAARLRSLTLHDITARLDDRFSLLTGSGRGIEPRQQTLRRLVDWSHDLLEPAEQVVFRRLAAFSGGATLDAAEVVCADPEPGPGAIAASDVADLIGRLVDKSLVLAEHRLDGVRYRMLQTLHDYADTRLLEAGEAEATRLRHAEHFAGLVAPVERGMMGPEQAQWLSRLRTERGNLTAAVEHALAVASADLAMRLVAPLGWCFFVAGEEAKGADLIEEALACSGPADPRLRSLALGSYAWLAASGPDLQRRAARGRRGPPRARHLRRPGDGVLRPRLLRHGAALRRKGAGQLGDGRAGRGRGRALGRPLVPCDRHPRARRAVPPGRGHRGGRAAAGRRRRRVRGRRRPVLPPGLRHRGGRGGRAARRVRPRHPHVRGGPGRRRSRRRGRRAGHPRPSRQPGDPPGQPQPGRDDAPRGPRPLARLGRPVAASDVAARAGHDRPPPRGPCGRGRPPRRGVGDGPDADRSPHAQPRAGGQGLHRRSAGRRRPRARAAGRGVAGGPPDRCGASPRQLGRGAGRRAGGQRHTGRRGAGRPPARPGRRHATTLGRRDAGSRALRRRPRRVPGPGHPR